MANGLTSLRVCAAPVLVFALLQNLHVLALALFALAVASDLLDGPLARARGSASARGLLFDHGSDALFVSSGCLALALRGDITLWLAPAIALAFLQYALGRARATDTNAGEHSARADDDARASNANDDARVAGVGESARAANIVARAPVPSLLGRWNGIAYFVLLGTPIVRDAFALGVPGAHGVQLFAWLLVASTLLSIALRWHLGRAR